jgi:hypothetical protein
VNDAIIREFVKAENIYISLNGDDVLDANENILDSSFTISNLSNLGADGKDEGIDLEKVILTYGDDPTIISFTAPSETNTTTNEICIVTQIGNDGTPSSQTIGDHLASSIPVKAFFYKRLSLDRRVVALTKVKINYYHDGITKQYDLFYHLRNLDYSN